MNVLIIGSEGFIGSHCVNYFLLKGYTVTGVDLCKKESAAYTYCQHIAGGGYNTVFERKSYNLCINAAGNGSVPLSIENPLADYASNCSELMALLHAVQQHNKNCKIIHLSSAAVYGTPEQLPVVENAYTQPLSPYGWHKLISEQICAEYVKLYGLHITVARPFSVYGPGLRKQLLWDIYQRSKQHTQIELWGTGNESRDFIFIADLVKSFDILFQSAPMRGEIYNLAAGEEISISNMAKKYAALLNSKIEITFNGMVRPGDPLNWCADITKLSQLGFTPATAIEDGLNETVRWIKEQ